MLQVVSFISDQAFERESTFDFLLDGFNYEIKNVDDDPSTFTNVLVIYSSTRQMVSEDVKNFVSSLSCPYALFHMSNEWMWAYYPRVANFPESEIDSAIEAHYGNPNHIFRNYWHPVFDCDKVTQLPIFWQNGFLNNKNIVNYNKIYKTTFIGDSSKNDRKDVISIMKSMGDCFIHETSGWMSEDCISVDKQVEVYSQSVICPCPMGGCHPEVFRMCEILESNSIPVIMQYHDFEYHNRIYGYDSPIPKIKYWDDLPKVYKQIVKSGVYETTERIQNWYQNWKAKTKLNFQSTLLSLKEFN